MKSNEAAYLGDGLYAVVEWGSVKLYASNGIETQNQVFLEPAVLANFIDYLKREGIMPREYR